MRVSDDLTVLIGGWYFTKIGVVFSSTFCALSEPLVGRLVCSVDEDGASGVEQLELLCDYDSACSLRYSSYTTVGL